MSPRCGARGPQCVRGPRERRWILTPLSPYRAPTLQRGCLWETFQPAFLIREQPVLSGCFLSVGRRALLLGMKLGGCGWVSRGYTWQMWGGRLPGRGLRKGPSKMHVDCSVEHWPRASEGQRAFGSSNHLLGGWGGRGGYGAAKGPRKVKRSRAL